MEKKWWFLVFIFLIMAAIIFSAATLLNKKPVKIIQGGIVITNEDFGMGSDTVSESYSGGGSIDVSEFDDSINPSPQPDPESEELTCWECPLGGTILNVYLSDLTDEMVQDLTNCTNVTQLVQIDCSMPPSNETNETCGNGICESYETVESCPQDCSDGLLSPPASDGDSGAQSDREENNEYIPEETEEISEGPKIEFYYDLTFDKKCVKLRKITGTEVDRCDPNDPTASVSGQVTAIEPVLSPIERSFVGCLYGKMFGLPWC